LSLKVLPPFAEVIFLTSTGAVSFVSVQHSIVFMVEIGQLLFHSLVSPFSLILSLCFPSLLNILIKWTVS